MLKLPEEALLIPKIIGKSQIDYRSQGAYKTAFIMTIGGGLSDLTHTLAKPVLVEQVAFGGDGIARHEGKVIFIEDALPGDVVWVREVEDKGRFSKATILRFETKSPLRGEVACAHFEECGGCSWLGIDYESQLQWKEQFVRSSLKRIGKLGELPLEMSGSPQSFRYRNRVLLKARWSRAHLEVGYFRRRTRDFTPIKRCIIGDEIFDEIIASLRNCGLAAPHAGVIPFKLEIQQVAGKGSTMSGVLITVFPESRPGAKLLAPIIEFLREHPKVLWAGFNFDVESAAYMKLEEHRGLTYFTQPTLFQQVNIEGNRTLRDFVIETVDEARPKRILDVYCGSGNLSLALVKQDRYVEGVEVNARSIACAKFNLERNELKGPAAYFAADAIKHLQKAADRHDKFDLVILDPPRQGCFEGVKYLLALKPQRIVYVSCDPNTLARDLNVLCQSQYQIRKVRCFDFFPQTFHIETVVILDMVG